MDIHILSAKSQANLEKLLRQINVDKGGIKIMAPKGLLYLIKIKSLTNIAANILKQETLSFGADTAVSRDTLTGKTKLTDCLIIANLLQLARLCEKLKLQPYGLNSLSFKLKETLSKYQKDNFILKLNNNKKLNLKARTHIMAVINMTPDSFSSDGLYGKSLDQCADYAQRAIDNGADILDIGGESSRPGSMPVTAKEEIRRIIPLIKALNKKKISVPISVDTCKPGVARQALDNGASIVNDISALNSKQMALIIKKYGAAVVLVHMRGRPANMQKKPHYEDVLSEIISYLEKSVNKALEAGINSDRIIVDPGIGFGKTVRHNLEILKRLNELKILGRPILVGASRKSFIGKILGRPCGQRLYGSLAAICNAALNGASIVRVHDVKETKQCLKVLDMIR